MVSVRGRSGSTLFSTAGITKLSVSGTNFSQRRESLCQSLLVLGRPQAFIDFFSLPTQEIETVACNTPEGRIPIVKFFYHLPTLLAVTYDGLHLIYRSLLCNSGSGSWLRSLASDFASAELSSYYGEYEKGMKIMMDIAKNLHENEAYEAAVCVHRKCIELAKYSKPSALIAEVYKCIGTV